MNSKEFSPNSDPNSNAETGPDHNPLAAQWLTAFPDLATDSAEKSAASPNPNLDLKSGDNSNNPSVASQLQDLKSQLAREELELMNLEGELAVAEALNSIRARQDAADEAEWERQKQEIERKEAEEARQDAEYEQMLADMEHEDAEYAALLDQQISPENNA